MMRKYLLSLSVLFALSMAGCSDSSNRQLLDNTRPEPDAGRDSTSPGPDGGQGEDAVGPSDSDAGTDADSGGEEINRAPDPLVANPDIEAQLRRPVKVVTDDFGMPHIFAESLEDLFFINGYTYASDRFAQMEFYRRIATGTLGELWGDASADATRTDVIMRTLGLKRSAERYLQANYDADSESYQALMAYCAGVNAYLAKYRAGEVALARGMAEAMPAAALPDWQPADVMAMSKLLALQLTYSAPTWIEWHALRQAMLDTFGADASDPAFAARDGFLADVLRLAPATGATHIDGLPGGTSPAIILPNTSAARAPSVDPALISRALALHDELGDLPGMAPLDIFGRRGPLARAGNNWVLHGRLTESGHPSVATDLHLPLGLPTPFYPIHLELSDDIDGRAPLKMIGAAMMGLPGVQLGRNDQMAWGASAAHYDTTDVYAEELSADSDAQTPPTVLFEGNQVAIERVSEAINIGTAGDITQTVDWTVEVVPHHGPILPTLQHGLPVTRAKGQALSVKWSGLVANNEMDFWMGLWRAKTPIDAEIALDSHGVGWSNFVFGFGSGQTFYSGQSDIPQRQPDALNYDPIDNPRGSAPIFILPGSGGAEWSGMLDERRIPHAYNPQTRFIVTANNDPVGDVLQNHPFDGLYYLGAFFDIGFRAERITHLIEAFSQNEQTLSLSEQMAIQNDVFDPAAARIAQRMINAIDHVTLASLEGSEDPEVLALLERYADRIDALEQYRDLLDIWDYRAPSTRSPAGPDVVRSAAASLFNAAVVNLLEAVYADEFEKLGFYGAGEFQFAGATQLLMRSLIFLLETPESAQTFDALTGDARIFDDLNTPDFTETRLSALVHAVVRAADRFENPADLGEVSGRAIPSPASSDYGDWVWGRMHGLALAAMMPSVSGEFQRPEAVENLPFYARGGGEFSVNPCAHGYRDFDFSCTAGAGLRLIHSMDPDNPQTFSAIAGGYSGDPSSPYFMSEFDLWQRGESRKLQDQEVLLDASNSAVIVYQSH